MKFCISIQNVLFFHCRKVMDGVDIFVLFTSNSILKFEMNWDLLAKIKVCKPVVCSSRYLGGLFFRTKWSADINSQKGF